MWTRGETGELRAELTRQRTDDGVAGLGDPPVGDAVQAHAAEVRTERKMPGPGCGDRVVAGDHRIDVVRHHTTREPDGVLVVIAGSLRSVTRWRVAVVDVVRCDDLIEPLRVAL